MSNYADSKFFEIKWAVVMYGESVIPMYVKNISSDGEFTVL